MEKVPVFANNCSNLVKIDYTIILIEGVLDLTILDLFLVVDCLLQAYQLFLIAQQQVSGRNLASKISLGWWSKSFLVEHILFIRSAWLYRMLFFNDFGWSVLLLRKVWWSAFFLNILVCNLLKKIISFDISCSNLINGCF